jgi:hypothetical protein
MKPAEIFDVCHARYRTVKDRISDRQCGIHTVNVETPSSGYQWRPERVRACEFAADFEHIGRRALRRPRWEGRLKVFETYFLQFVEYRLAIVKVGVAEGTFDYWIREVKRAVGQECVRSGLFPPSRYFQPGRNFPLQTMVQRPASQRSPV